MSPTNFTPTTTPIFNATDPLNLAGLEKTLSQIHLVHPFVWLVTSLFIRLCVTQVELDSRGTGILGLVFSTLTAAHLTITTDWQWSCVLRDCQSDHSMVNLSDYTQLPKSSIQRHHWHWSEYLVDCICFKKHIWVPPRTQDANGDTTKRTKATRHSSTPQKKRVISIKAGRLATGKVRDTCSSDIKKQPFKTLRLAYGNYDVEIPDEKQCKAYHFHNDRFNIALSTIICFTLSGWGLAYRGKVEAITFTIVADIAVIAVWLCCRRFPSIGEPWDFCQSITKNANRIHAIGTDFRNDTERHTIDVVVYFDCQQRWTWCRIGDNWISVMIPTEKPFAEYGLGILCLLAHTLLPIGWINETNFKPNIIFALLALSLDQLHPVTGSLAGIWISSVLHMLGMQPPKTGDWWIISFYVWLYLRISGGYNLAAFISWVLTSGVTLYGKTFG